MKFYPRLILAAVLLAGVSGCAQLGYTVQAMQGQLSLMSQAKPIDDWLSDPLTTNELKERLRRVRSIRTFAAKELSLPDNGSYKKYADLKRQYVLWNVVATPELSVKPNQWCFPVAGCVDYRGYYSKAAAQSFANNLQRDGFDVRVSGVPAYSTLGWFDDPVLSTFIAYPDAELARLVFHELAHQVAYAPGDSSFNEAFATAVEEFGVERWLTVQGSDALREDYKVHQQRRQDFLALLAQYRLQLEENFSSMESDTTKRARKAVIFQSLQTHYVDMKKQRWGGYEGYDRWFSEPMSNAHFALIATYHDLLPAFRQLLTTKQTLPAFYQSVRALAKLDKKKRREQLARYQPPAEPPTPQQTVAVQ